MYLHQFCLGLQSRARLEIHFQPLRTRRQFDRGKSRKINIRKNLMVTVLSIIVKMQSRISCRRTSPESINLILFLEIIWSKKHGLNPTRMRTYLWLLKFKPWPKVSYEKNNQLTPQAETSPTSRTFFTKQAGTSKRFRITSTKTNQPSPIQLHIQQKKWSLNKKKL